MRKRATIEDGLILTKLLYKILNKKYFVGLTGGLVYQEGSRKDIDIVIYRNREQLEFEVADIIDKLAKYAGFTNVRCYGFVTKVCWQGFDVDILHPETTSQDAY